ncbi:MAG: RDD family protein [Acidimicrobiales bacterium]|nr:RDD family protein [Acidimicrobiales bacterium]
MTFLARLRSSLVARRLAARLIDVFTVFFCTFALAVTVLVPVTAPLTDLLDRGPWGRALGPAVLIAVVGIVYEAVFTAARGQTPAKDLLCIKVVARSTPDTPTPLRAVLRAAVLWSWVLLVHPALIALFAVGLAFRGGHDRLFDTEVIPYDADAVEGPIVAAPPTRVIEARYGARSWWRSLTGTVGR